MTTTSDFMFNNMGRIGSDVTDNSQRNISNDRYSGYILNNHFTNSDDTVRFATLQPTINFRGNGGGFGLSGMVAVVLNPVIVANLVANPVRKSDIEAIKQNFSCACTALLVAQHLGQDFLKP